VRRLRAGKSRPAPTASSGKPAPPERRGHVHQALAGLTPRGRAFVAAGILCLAAGVALDQRDLVRVGILVLALPTTAAIFLTRARYRIAAQRHLDRSRAPVGSVLRIELEVRNAGRMPSPLLLAQDALPPELGAAEGEGARFVLPRIAAGANTTVSYGVRPGRRGRYTIGPLSVRLADPFGFCQVVRTFATTARISVLPSITPLRIGRLGGQWGLGGESRQRGIMTGDEQDVTTRPYRPGDDRRRVHWRTTARTGELSVRRDEQPWQSRGTVLLDTRKSAHSSGGRSESFEFAVSAAASISAAMINGGYGVRLVDDLGAVLAESQSTSMEAGFGVMDALANVDRRPNATLLPLATRLGGEGGDPDSIIAVLGATTPNDLAAMIRASSRSTRCVCILVDSPSWGRPSGQPSTGVIAARDLLYRSGWSAVIAGPGSNLEMLWHELQGAGQVSSPRWVG
jgi:uncharacterized protein (DUF58 family)